MTPEQSDTLDALYSGGMLTGKVFLGGNNGTFVMSLL